MNHKFALLRRAFFFGLIGTAMVLVGCPPIFTTPPISYPPPSLRANVCPTAGAPPQSTPQLCRTGNNSDCANNPIPAGAVAQNATCDSNAGVCPGYGLCRYQLAAGSACYFGETRYCNLQNQTCNPATGPAGCGSQPCSSAGGSWVTTECDAIATNCGLGTQACCPNGSCYDGFTCAGSTCVACGSQGATCCGHGACNSGLACTGNVCAVVPPCGGAGQGCCGGAACNGGLTCSGGSCVAIACGGSGQPCCAQGASCQNGNICQSGTCTVPAPCGSAGIQCCANGQCGGGLACVSANCVPCNVTGAVCCPGNTCTSNLACSGNICQPHCADATTVQTDTVVTKGGSGLSNPFGTSDNLTYGPVSCPAGLQVGTCAATKLTQSPAANSHCESDGWNGCQCKVHIGTKAGATIQCHVQVTYTQDGCVP